MADGPDLSTAELHERLQRAQDELIGANETIRRQSAALGQARREADPEKRMLNHENYDRCARHFRIWQRATGHTRSHLTPDRFKNAQPFLSRYEDEMIGRAIEGIAFDPYVTLQKNGRTERHDGWDQLFKSADRFERYANKAPENWKETLAEQLEAEGVRF